MLLIGAATQRRNVTSYSLEQIVHPHLRSRRVAVMTALPTAPHIAPVELPHWNRNIESADDWDVGVR
jgi:hypothetical protein